MDLMDILKEAIRLRGPLTFRDFMDLVLYHPMYGYYSKGGPPIGRAGDFVTSPHTHALYGALHARQIEEFWEVLGRPVPFRVVEMGAGTGYWAYDILTYLEEKSLFDVLRYVIIEPFMANKAVQEQRLERFVGKLTWVEDIHQLRPGSGCFISNELIDAFPVHLVEKGKSDFREVYVGLGDGELTESVGPLSSVALARYVEDLPRFLSVGYRTEINLGMKEWVRDVSEVFTEGFVVTVDYGHSWKEYYDPRRSRGTLLAYKEHRVHEEVLLSPGHQDLTAHVNFSDLARWGREAGLVTLGYSSQWAFLAGLDVKDTLKEITGETLEPFSPQLAAVKMLILPQGMGESHKVLVQAKGVSGGVELKGLKFRNMKHRLDER